MNEANPGQAARARLRVSTQGPNLCPGKFRRNRFSVPCPWATSTRFERSRRTSGQRERREGASARSAALIPCVFPAAQVIFWSVERKEQRDSPRPWPGFQSVMAIWTGTSVRPRVAPADSKSITANSREDISEAGLIMAGLL